MVVSNNKLLNRKIFQKQIIGEYQYIYKTNLMGSSFPVDYYHQIMKMDYVGVIE